MTAKCNLCGDAIQTLPTPKRRRDREKTNTSERDQLLRLMAEHIDEEHPEEAEDCADDAGNVAGILLSDNFECKSESFNKMKVKTLQFYIKQLGEIREELLKDRYEEKGKVEVMPRVEEME